MKIESTRIWAQTLVRYITNLGLCILTWSCLTIDRNHRYRAWSLYQSFPSLSESFFLLREMWLERVGGCWRGVGCEINGLISLYQDLTRQLHFSEIWQTDVVAVGPERTVNDGQKGKSALTRTTQAATEIFWNPILTNTHQYFPLEISI